MPVGRVLGSSVIQPGYNSSGPSGVQTGGATPPTRDVKEPKPDAAPTTNHQSRYIPPHGAEARIRGGLQLAPNATPGVAEQKTSGMKIPSANKWGFKPPKEMAQWEKDHKETVRLNKQGDGSSGYLGSN